MAECANAIVEGFAEATEDRLDHIGPGCFVQKMEVCGTCCWVEITDETNDSYEGIAHPALSDGGAQAMFKEGDVVQVTKDQITALGCDRYCFC
jgi:hypothetical protein